MGELCSMDVLEAIYCIALFAGDAGTAGGYAFFAACMQVVKERELFSLGARMMHCMTFCMPEAVEGGHCLMEAL